jgi:hypothetical protein
MKSMSHLIICFISHFAGVNRGLIDVETKMMGASKKISIEEEAISAQNENKTSPPIRDRPSLHAPEKVTVVGYAFLILLELLYLLFSLFFCFLLYFLFLTSFLVTCFFFFLFLMCLIR